MLRISFAESVHPPALVGRGMNLYTLFAMVIEIWLTKLFYIFSEKQHLYTTFTHPTLAPKFRKMCFGSSTMKLSTTKRVRSTVQFRGATSATSLLCSQNAAISSQISGCHFDPVIKNKGHNSTHTNKIDLSPPYSAFLQPPFGHSTEITNALQQTKPKKRLGTGMNAYQMQTNYSITK